MQKVANASVRGGRARFRKVLARHAAPPLFAFVVGVVATLGYYSWKASPRVASGTFPFYPCAIPKVEGSRQSREAVMNTALPVRAAVRHLESRVVPTESQRAWEDIAIEFPLRPNRIIGACLELTFGGEDPLGSQESLRVTSYGTIRNEAGGALFEKAMSVNDSQLSTLATGKFNTRLQALEGSAIVSTLTLWILYSSDPS
jgi:hypothetical protein